jgi:hypothetical protein
MRTLIERYAWADDPALDLTWCVSVVEGSDATAVQRRIFRHCSFLPFSIPLPPFPMHVAFPRSEYYGDSAPSRTDQPTWAQPQTPCWRRGARGRTGTVPVVTRCSIVEGRARLCPRGLVTATPQHVTVASPHDRNRSRGEFPTDRVIGRDAPHPAPIHQV